MRYVRVRVTANGREAEIHPVYDVWANADFIERSRALQWKQSGETLGILHFAEGDPDAFEAAIRAIPEVLEYEIERVGEDAFYAYLHDSTTDSLREMFGPLTAGAFVVVPPIVYKDDGWVTISLFGPDEELQSVVDRMPDPVEVAVEEVSGLGAAAPVVGPRLSDRQREAVDAALDLGYYEIPREASHEDVAGVLDCAPSTAAEHLRKAEAKLVRNGRRNP